jgi:DNA mismatch repair protein MSH5
MDIHIGDLHSLIVDREIEIMQELLEDILVYEQSMSHACDVCAELDCLLSFAEASRLYNYQRPQMVEENVIDIYQGRYDAMSCHRQLTYGILWQAPFARTSR